MLVLFLFGFSLWVDFFSGCGRWRNSAYDIAVKLMLNIIHSRSQARIKEEGPTIYIYFVFDQNNINSLLWSVFSSDLIAHFCFSGIVIRLSQLQQHFTPSNLLGFHC